MTNTRCPGGPLVSMSRISGGGNRTGSISTPVCLIVTVRGPCLNHAFFTTTDPAVLDTVAADKAHRSHAIIEQVHADLKDSVIAHLPSGVSPPTRPGSSSP